MQASSQCFYGTLLMSGYVQSYDQRPSCYSVACTGSGASATYTVTAASGATVTCTAANKGMALSPQHMVPLLFQVSFGLPMSLFVSVVARSKCDGIRHCVHGVLELHGPCSRLSCCGSRSNACSLCAVVSVCVAVSNADLIILSVGFPISFHHSHLLTGIHSLVDGKCKCKCKCKCQCICVLDRIAQ